MDQEAYVVLATLTVALSLLVLALTYFDFLRIYRQRREVRWLLEEARSSMDEKRASKAKVSEWQVILSAMSKQRHSTKEIL